MSESNADSPVASSKPSEYVSFAAVLAAPPGPTPPTATQESFEPVLVSAKSVPASHSGRLTGRAESSRQGPSNASRRSLHHPVTTFTSSPHAAFMSKSKLTPLQKKNSSSGYKSDSVDNKLPQAASTDSSHRESFQYQANRHSFTLLADMDENAKESSETSVEEPQDAEGPQVIAEAADEQTDEGVEEQSSLFNSDLDAHPLNFAFTFSYIVRSAYMRNDYEDHIKQIGSFSTIEEFWSIYSHLKRPGDVKCSLDYHLFRQGVRPAWEDPQNCHGGRWVVRLKKGLASRTWENLIMAFIGDQFNAGVEICGIVVSVRKHDDVLSLWNKSGRTGKLNLRIRDMFKRILNLPFDSHIEYKPHMVQNAA